LFANTIGFNSTVNEYLKTIGKAIGIKEIDFYAARHTWATLFVKECEDVSIR
jgi:integrase